MKYIHTEIKNNLLFVTVNRPEKLNALNSQMLQELYSILQTSAEQGVKALILTGAGSKAFIVGADIQEMASFTSEEMLSFCRLGQQVADALEMAPFLTIAAVNGYALGAGFEMALACDFIYAGEDSQFGFPEIKLGLIPGFGGTQRLTRAVGVRKAKELIIGAVQVSARDALALGLIRHITPVQGLLSSCEEAVKQLTTHSLIAVLQAKNVINSVEHLSKDAALELERNMSAFCLGTEECRKGMHLFLHRKV
jgi:enoyl-CoA hydratase